VRRELAQISRAVLAEHRRDAPHAARACPLCTALANPAAAPPATTASVRPAAAELEAELDDVLL